MPRAGSHQLLVRPIVPPPFKGVQRSTAAHEKSSFGHRRLRGAAIAGVATAPCMGRAMTDEEARRAQIAENLQRADVHPVGEAEDDFTCRSTSLHARVNAIGRQLSVA